MILRLSLMILGILIIQGCSTKQPLYVDRPKEVIKVKGCEVPTILFCSIRDGTYTDIIDDMDKCITELFIVINKCSLEKEIESKAPD